MSHREPKAKKRKTSHQNHDRQPHATASFKPSACFTPVDGGRDWTLSVAVASSILTGLATADQRMTATARVARALAVFSVDEVVVYDDSPASSRPGRVDTTAYTGDTDPCHFLAHILSFLETPPFMRRTLFPLHPNLRLTALLPSLDMPHHPNPKDWLPYREGVTLAADTHPRSGTLVDVGWQEPFEVQDQIPPKTRVTLRMPPQHQPSSQPECVHPSAPRLDGGYYWGYSVRQSASLSSVFTESPYEDGYDLSIGTSERGQPVSRLLPPSSSPDRPPGFKHLLVVFGGPRGIEYAAMNDDDLVARGIQGPRTKDLFDHWVNVLPDQGSRTIRTDEAMLIALTALRPLWHSGG